MAKNQALRVLAHLLRTQGAALAAHNAQDIERAQAAGLAAPMVDRLRLTPQVLETCAPGLRAAGGYTRHHWRNHGYEAAAQRYPRGPDACAHWRVRHDLRKPPECDD